MKAKLLRCCLASALVLYPRLYAQPDASDDGKLSDLRAKAEAGDDQSQLHLAKAYQHGTLGLATNLASAVTWYRKAADQGNPVAQFNLWICYAKGEGTQKDSAAALDWLRKAADQSYPEAQYTLGGLFALGSGVKKDLAEAKKWLRLAADQGHAEAQFNLGVLFSLADDLTEVIKWWRAAADRNNANAQFNLAICYLKGTGIPKEEEEAVKWFRKAADQGMGSAARMLSESYQNGTGVPKSESEALKWLQKAAEQGDSTAQYQLALKLWYGDGVTEDVDQAALWLEKAAQQGQPHAYLARANILAGNDPKDAVTLDMDIVGGTASPKKDTMNKSPKATAWLLRKQQQLAQTGTTEDDLKLARKYAKGDGIPKDLQEAEKWYLKAAERNDATAQEELAGFYWERKASPNDSVEAYKWAYIAVQNGSKFAKRFLPEFDIFMDKQQRVEGKTRAETWLEQQKKKTTSVPPIDHRDPNNLGPDAKRNGVKIGTAYLAFDTAKETLFTPMKQFDINLTDDTLKAQIQDYMTQQVRSKGAKSK